MQFKVVFENGMSASVKVIEPFSLWPKEFDVIDAHTYKPTQTNPKPTPNHHQHQRQLCANIPAEHWI